MLTLSLLGIYNEDNTIINDANFPLPSGLSHETLDPMLLAETAELEILYPEPTTLKTVIKAWATARNPAWTKMLAALNASYNPIHNYDRSESWTEEKDGENSRSGSNDRDATVSTSGTSTGSESATLTQNVAGYNSSQSNVPKSSDSSSGRRSGEESSTTTTGQDDSWQEDGTNSETVTRTGTVSGNIGVTTSQQMIQSELELRQIDMYRKIINEFIRMFCLGVY